MPFMSPNRPTVSAWRGRGGGEGSSLARYARVMLGLVAVWLAWAIWCWAKEPSVERFGVVLLIAGGHTVVLGLECLLAAWCNRRDPVPGATAGEWGRAWWRECGWAVRVFAWRQPFRWRHRPDPVVADTPRPAVVFVHGFVCNRGFWFRWLAVLQAQSRPYVTVNLEPVFGSLDDYVDQVEAAVCRAHDLGAGPPLVVAHSMGGLAVRAWRVARDPQARRVSRVVTIGSPHHGTALARGSGFTNGRQMVPDGPWLRALRDREAALWGGAAHDRFVCWYSNTDNIVFPASTATLPGADNRLVRGAAHVDLAQRADVMASALALGDLNP